MPSEKTDLLLKAVRPAHVIPVHTGHIFPRRMLQASVEGEGKFSVLFVSQENDPVRVFVSVFFSNLIGLIRGRIIAEDQFPVCIGLRQNRFNSRR